MGGQLTFLLAVAVLAATEPSFADIPVSFAIDAGGSTAVLGGWQTLPPADSSFRFNVGFLETTRTGTSQIEANGRQ